MQVITRIEEMKAAAAEIKSRGRSIGFVPTMGYLHEGHISLIRSSIKNSDVTVVSIFVNPTQFGPKEDFKEYPRDIERDTEILEKEGVDYLFLPDARDMYPEGYRTYVEVQKLQDKLCGRSRPDHFRGVCTVVLKLFNIVKPDKAYFGQKDAQQAIILNRMVKDLDLDVKLEILPIVREEDGLALSSRNEYLDSEERKSAAVLYKSLRTAWDMICKGERNTEPIIQRMRELIEKEKLAAIDYIEIVDAGELEPVELIEGKVLIALAVFIGRTRLIDNIMINIKGNTCEVEGVMK